MQGTTYLHARAKSVYPFLHIFFVRDTKDLPDIVAEREKHVKGLEGAVTNAIAASYKHHAKNKSGDQIEGGGSWVIPDKLRPTHRVSPLPISVPCVGRKVDSLEYYHKEISDLNGKILAAQRSPEAYPQLSSAFIEFNQQIAAHMAAQCVIHSHELQMAPRFLQIAPSDIIWDNMNIKSLERLIRRFISLTLTSAIVIFWIIPGKSYLSHDYHMVLMIYSSGFCTGCCQHPIID